MPARLAILASGSGSNLEALAAACAGGRLDAEVVGVVCNRPGAGAVARAERLGLPALVCDHEAFATRDEHEEAALAWLAAREPDWIALAGYMRVLGPRFLGAYPGRIVNIHPADTRRHRGTGGYEWALREGLAGTIVTVHLVDAGLDTGQIIMQAPVPVFPDDTVATLTARGLAVEHDLYPRALARLLAATVPRLAGSTRRPPEPSPAERLRPTSPAPPGAPQMEKSLLPMHTSL